MKRLIQFTSICLLAYSHVLAQDAQTTVTYNLTAETAFGSGDFTAYQLSTNRYHTLATRPNTAYLRGAVNVEHQLSEDWKLSGAADVIASIHADHKAYLQQCYVNLSWKDFFLEAGARELKPVLRDPLLSSGAFTKGNNAKPMPQVHVGTNGFWTVPYTKGWLQINADFGYGKLMDSDYRERQFNREGSGNWHYATGAYYHQKHLYFRTNPEKTFFVTAGIEHVAQFGGTGYDTETGEMVVKKKAANLKAFWKVILPVGDKNYFENDAMEDWVYGNHIGSMTILLGWNINKAHQVQAYVDDIFEDAIRQQVLIATEEADLVLFLVDVQTGVTAQGNALLVSPIYNKDGFADFRDNRIKAWHIAVNGDITDRLSYLVKGSYREGWGTYANPLPHKHHSFDAMLQGIYTIGPWQFSGAYAFDKGNIYGDCNTFNIKIGYHGKIL